ncbi:MAG: threonine/serine exporter family protein [Clostridiales bacterium]|jgi:uncharacterized membrane protein YjjP (DUF1212 family)|nr:threonine/serine exporter family protein [Clostridiales bacterium]
MQIKINEKMKGKGMDSNKALYLTLLAGEIMLSNGAETYRVEDTMIRLLDSLGHPGAEAFVTTTGIFASLEDSNASCKIKRVKTRTYHLEKLAKVNELSRNLAEGRTRPEEAQEQLLKIKSLPPYPPALRTAASGVCCFSFCWIFGGSWRDCLLSFLIGIAVHLFHSVLEKRNISGFLSNLTCAALISALAIAGIGLGIGINMDKTIIAAIMPFAPGIAMTNGVRDIVEGDFISGGSRMTEALMTALAIAVGVGFVIRMQMILTGGI